MALAAHNFTIQDDAGNIVTDVDIEVRADTVGQPLVQLFADRDGLSALGNPFTSATGTGRFHVAGGAYQIRASKDGFEAIYRYVPIGTAGENDFEHLTDFIQGIIGELAGFVYFASLSAALGSDLSSFDVIYVGGYADEGDGGAAVWHNRTTNEPTHGAKRQDSAGNWFELDRRCPDPRMLGAVDDPSLTTDSSGAFQQWLEFIVPNGLAGVIGPGDYLFDSRASYTMTAPKGFSIRGAGIDVTRLVGGASNTDGLINVTMYHNASQPDNTSRAEVSGIRCIPGRAGAGTALRFAFDSGSTSVQHTRNVIMRDVEVYAGSNAGSVYFNDGIDITRAGRFLVDAVRVFGDQNPANHYKTPVTISSFGAATPGVVNLPGGHGLVDGSQCKYNDGGGTAPAGSGLTGDDDNVTVWNVSGDTCNLATNALAAAKGSFLTFSDTGSGSAHTLTEEDYSNSSPKYAMDRGLIADFAYNPEVRSSHFGICKVGISAIGNAQEGFTLQDTNIVGVQVAFLFYRTSSQPSVYIRNVHCNFRDIGFYLDGVKNPIIDGCVPSQQSAIEIRALPACDFILRNVAGADILRSSHISGNSDVRRRWYFLDDTTNDRHNVFADWITPANGATPASSLIEDIRIVDDTNDLSCVDSFIFINDSGSNVNRIRFGMPSLRAAGFIGAAPFTDPNNQVTVDRVNQEQFRTASAASVTHNPYAQDSNSHNMPVMIQQLDLPGARTITLPISTTTGVSRPWNRCTFEVVRIDAGAHDMSLTPDGGSAVVVLGPGERGKVMYDRANDTWVRLFGNAS